MTDYYEIVLFLDKCATFFGQKLNTHPVCSPQPNHGGGNSSTPTEWSYLDQKHRRTASLSRNLTRRSRSVTMPNIEAAPQPQSFTTFHTGSTITN